MSGSHECVDRRSREPDTGLNFGSAKKIKGWCGFAHAGLLTANRGQSVLQSSKTKCTTTQYADDRVCIYGKWVCITVWQKYVVPVGRFGIARICRNPPIESQVLLEKPTYMQVLADVWNEHFIDKVITADLAAGTATVSPRKQAYLKTLR